MTAPSDDPDFVTILELNGISLRHQSEALYALTLGVAEGRIDKASVRSELVQISGYAT